MSDQRRQNVRPGSSNRDLPKLRKAELVEEVRRLRARTHELQADHDRRTAKLARDVGRLNLAFERARVTMEGLPADWTTQPDAKFWHYTSVVTRDALAFMAARITEVEAERDNWRLRAERAERES